MGNKNVALMTVLILNIISFLSKFPVCAMDIDGQEDNTKNTASLSLLKNTEEKIKAEFEANRKQMQRAKKRVDRQLKINQPRPVEVKK